LTLPSDEGDVSGRPARGQQREHPLLLLYDRALPEVYGYLFARCESMAVAEDLTSETFLAAVAAMRAGEPPLSVPWLIGIARHKLVDHWRARAREASRLSAVAGERAGDGTDPWDAHLDALRAQQTLEALSPIHHAVLVLRYFDDLPVPQVAAELGRTRHATEALISRARAAFRSEYEQRGGKDA
jgi:RNA polymerase sigma-70 factor (ECF subfamily)